VHVCTVEVIHISCNMCICDLPDMHALSLQAYSPWESHVHVTTNACTYIHTHMVLLNYNFISTHMDTHGNTRYFTCKMQKFPMEIIISTRRDVVFPRDETWHSTRQVIAFARDVIN